MLVTMEKIMLKSNPTLPQHRKDRGFTLIELMVTVFILGILTSMALPSYREFIINQRIKSTSFDLMSSINLARSEAIKRNAPVSVTPTSSDWAKGWTVYAGASMLSQQSAQLGLTIGCFIGSPLAAAACSAINFMNNGRSLNTQSIQISNVATTSVRCISIDLSGRPNSKKGNC